MPTSGGLHHGLRTGAEIGCTAVQVFTASPRQWQHPELAEEHISAFHAAREETGLPITIAHDSYLINLAAPDADLLERSRQAFRRELERAHQLGISWVVTHMGAHLNQGEEAALQRIVGSLNWVLAETDASGCTSGVALETTAGQGTGLGWRFEELGAILNGVGDHARLGVCLDTCHIFAAGYDIRDAAAYDQTMALFDELVGFSRLKVIHANDSKKALGSRVDRHEHIGEGEIGWEAFRLLLADERLAHVPVIVETPESDTMHAVNVDRLWRMARSQPVEMEIQVQLFGHYSELSPQPLQISVPWAAPLGKLVKKLAASDKRLAGIESYCRFAVAEEYAPLDQQLEPGDVVAVLPPMSGG